MLRGSKNWTSSWKVGVVLGCVLVGVVVGEDWCVLVGVVVGVVLVCVLVGVVVGVS